MPSKTVIITGASRGLGAAAAQIAGETGANVVLNSRSENELNNVAQRIDPSGERVLVVPGDVSKESDCRALVEQSVEHFGRLDAIVNNAGVLEPIAPIAESDPQLWDKNVAVNLLAPFYLVRYALRHLRAQQGRVINVSSGAAVRATVGWSAYCATKAGLNHFTRVLAAEEKDVVSIAFRPGMVDTAMQETIREEGTAGMQAETHQRFLQYHEQGELLPPDVPGRALAILALHAPLEWSGEFMSWDDARIQGLVVQQG